MIINFEGREWNFDREKITVDEWRELKRKYKMTPKGFQDGIVEADPDASTFLYWAMLHQAGQRDAPLGDNLKPDIIALNSALSESDAAEEAEAEAAAKAELEAAAQKEAELARLVPTSPGGPVSPGLPSRPDTTLMPLDAMEAARAPSSTGSGTGTSSSSGPTTSSSSPGSAGSATAISGG
jgi:hypothetical protein